MYYIIIYDIWYIIYHTSYIIYMYIYIEYSFVIVVYRMLDTPISHIAKVAAAEGPVSGVDCLARASQHTHGTARHGLATIATCLAHGVTRPADQELRRTKLRLLRTGGAFCKDSWSYKSCLLLVIYGSRWVLPSWNYRPPIFGFGH